MNHKCFQVRDFAIKNERITENYRSTDRWMLKNQEFSRKVFWKQVRLERISTFGLGILSTVLD